MAIMLNNRGVAQPQLGISKADIIYETLVEGGITRMIAIYQDISGVGVIGSVRSARHYYLDIAQGHDAVYIHAGGSPQAYTAIAARGIANIDGVNGGRHQIFYRDPDRRKNMGYEHSMVTSSELIAQYLPTYGMRLEHEDGYEYKTNFSGDDEAIAGGETATDITVTFSGAKSTSFTYDEAEKAYLVSQYNKPYTDGNDGSQLAVANILVLEASINRISGDSEGRLDIKLSGSGAGHYINGGKSTEINWAKKDASSQFTYTLESGEELVMGRGRIYVCIAPGGALSY
jgi:hypothetical protein